MPTTFCRHIRSNGLRCGSPALRTKPYCYHHCLAHSHRRALTDSAAETAAAAETVLHSMVPGTDSMQRNPVLAPYLNPKPEPMTLTFPPLEDRESIGIALSLVLGALARKRIDAKDATPLIYGLQVASANAKGFRGHSERDAVTEVVVDEHGEELAPDVDPPSPWAGLADYADDDEEGDDDEDVNDEDVDEALRYDRVPKVADYDVNDPREARAAVELEEMLEKMVALSQ